MTKTIRNLIAAMLLIGASHGAMAGFQNGNTLLTACESENYAEQGRCHGYMEAAHDAYRTAAAWHGFEPNICMSVGVSSNQLQKVFVKYANENPESLHYSASNLVLLAYIKAFPCD